MNIFFGRKKRLIQEAYQRKALIIDVRTHDEFRQGHIHGSKNISLQTLQSEISKLKRNNQAIITCCASGIRSSSARRILKSNGISDVVNGGSWNTVNNYISELKAVD